MCISKPVLWDSDILFDENQFADIIASWTVIRSFGLGDRRVRRRLTASERERERVRKREWENDICCNIKKLPYHQRSLVVLSELVRCAFPNLLQRKEEYTSASRTRGRHTPTHRRKRKYETHLGGKKETTLWFPAWNRRNERNIESVRIWTRINFEYFQLLRAYICCHSSMWAKERRSEVYHLNSQVSLSHQHTLCIEVFQHNLRGITLLFNNPKTIEENLQRRKRNRQRRSRGEEGGKETGHEHFLNGNTQLRNKVAKKFLSPPPPPTLQGVQHLSFPFLPHIPWKSSFYLRIEGCPQGVPNWDGEGIYDVRFLWDRIFC